MKILSLFLLSFLSTHAFAHDWQYAIKYPDGKIEVKRLSNSENFMFPVQDYICSVNPYESESEEDEFGKYEINCLAKNGMHATINFPEQDKEFNSINFWIQDEKGQNIKIEMLVFHHLPKKARKPFMHQEV